MVDGTHGARGKNPLASKPGKAPRRALLFEAMRTRGILEARPERAASWRCHQRRQVDRRRILGRNDAFSEALDRSAKEKRNGRRRPWRDAEVDGIDVDRLRRPGPGSSSAASGRP
jgi:hypothetical protein